MRKKMGFVKPLSVLVCLHSCFIFPLYGATLSFLVIETGVRQGSPVQESSQRWETGLMDAFFEAGHIVSNAAIMQVPRRPEGEFPQEAQGKLQEAIAGGSDFFILVLMEYPGTREHPSPRPQSISLKLFSIQPYHSIGEQHYPQTISKSPSEELLEVKKAARIFLAYLGG
ncbi:MAG: hypothetical protein LBQ30_09950 [Treponema sp.]|jgi:hypothetical protein|nr:hypothetical protein [Treponema sp.]